MLRSLQVDARPARRSIFRLPGFTRKRIEEPEAYDILVSGYPARVVSYTPEQWAAIPPAIRPQASGRLHGHHVAVIMR
jgi:hypothetical protein